MTSTRLVPTGLRMTGLRITGLRITGLALAGLALAACGGQPGAAAIVGPDRISEDQLAAQVEEVYVAQGQSVDTVDPGVTSSVLTMMIQVALVEQVAQDLGVDVPQGAIDRKITDYVTQSGGAEQFQQVMLQGGIAPSQIEPVVRMSMQVESIGMRLAPNATPDEQRAAATDEIVGRADRTDIEVSPRYGEWSTQTLQVGPLTTDLSIPAESQNAQ